MSQPDTTAIASMTNTAGELTMSSITGKLVLSLIRKSDFAHAGEAESIDLVFASLPKANEQRLLDVGCGIGGTAQYVEDRQWGKVTGIDIDANNIDAAIRRHSSPTFICSDATDLAQNVAGHFDVIYSLNAFFLFADQAGALRAMRKVASPGTKLAIFDYVDLGGYNTGTSGRRSALILEDVERLLRESGWELERTVSLNAEYLRWYEELVAAIKTKRKAIEASSSAEFYEYVLARYSETLVDAQAGTLGGATVYATAA